MKESFSRVADNQVWLLLMENIACRDCRKKMQLLILFVSKMLMDNFQIRGCSLATGEGCWMKILASSVPYLVRCLQTSGQQHMHFLGYQPNSVLSYKVFSGCFTTVYLHPHRDLIMIRHIIVDYFGINCPLSAVSKLVLLLVVARMVLWFWSRFFLFIIVWTQVRPGCGLLHHFPEF